MLVTDLLETGIIHALVYRHHSGVTVLEVTGDPPELEPFAHTSPGGDWDEVNILHEDGPPNCPPVLGLWAMAWPWRRLSDEERAKDWELCCKYVGRPEWRQHTSESLIEMLNDRNLLDMVERHQLSPKCVEHRLWEVVTGYNVVVDPLGRPQVVPITTTGTSVREVLGAAIAQVTA
jgi:hypothetical protein